MIDGSELLSKYKIRSRFEDITLNTDQLSTGCKTVLNVLYFQDKIFCLKECGNNALEILYSFDVGNVYSEYAMIPFNMERVKVQNSRECMAINPQILCLNNYDYQKDIKEIIRQAEGKLIVIDNADILLNDDTRKYISLDDRNQYLIIGRNPKNLFATKENLFELASEKVGEQTVFTIEPYL